LSSWKDVKNNTTGAKWGMGKPKRSTAVTAPGQQDIRNNKKFLLNVRKWSARLWSEIPLCGDVLATSE